MVNKLTQQLNYYRKMVLGAAGTCTPRFMHPPSEVASLSEGQRAFLRGVDADGNKIVELLQKQAADIEMYYTIYGNPRTKKSIARRQDIREKLRRGDYVSDEDMECYMSGGRKSPKKPRQSHQELAQALRPPVR